MYRKVVIVTVMLVPIIVLMAYLSPKTAVLEPTITSPLPEVIEMETANTAPLLTSESTNYCVEFGCGAEQWCSSDGCICTEMDCLSQFHVLFEGVVPSAYLAEATDSSGQKAILHCFEPDTGDNFPYSSKDYALNEFGLEQVRKFSSAVALCEANSKGRARVTLRANGVPDLVAIHCFALSGQDSHDFLWFSSCSRGSFTLVYPTLSLPQDITVTIHTDSYSKTVSFQPEFEPFWPNGSACPPTCYETTVTLQLP